MQISMTTLLRSYPQSFRAIAAALIATLLELALLFVIQLQHEDIPVLLLFYVHATIMVFTWRFIQAFAPFRKIFLLSTVIITWLIAVMTLRCFTPRIVCSQIYIEASSIRSLDYVLWKNFHGKYLLLGEPYDNSTANAPIFIDSGYRNLTEKDMRHLFESALRKRCRTGVRYSSFDICLRPTGIVIQIDE